MSLRDVLEYRAADSGVISLSEDDMPRDGDVTIYARPWGATQWGYHSGPMRWDDEYHRSHEVVPS